MSEWIGYGVSVNCGETLGCYQGTIVHADKKAASLTLTKPFRNGFQYPKSQVTLNAADIRELRIISGPAEGGEGEAGGSGRRARATVCEALQANHSDHVTDNGNLGSNVQNNHVRSRQKAPAPAAASRPALASGTPRSRGEAGAPPGDRARRRNEACFGSAASPALQDDFDFEGNLALFDKRAVWASMRHAKPDLVRGADPKYRHDEDVLVHGNGQVAATPCTRLTGVLCGAFDYVTDSGARVQSVSDALRRRLWESAKRLGLADSALTLVARAACDVALRLVGGSRRLEARNAHQVPCVVCVAGRHAGGAAGLQTARLLASRGARVHVLLAGASGETPCAALDRELSALALDGVRAHAVPDEGGVPAAPAPDLVVVALYDPLSDTDMSQYDRAEAWVRGTRAAAVCVEPAGRGWEGPGARASVLGLAVPPLAAALGRVLLADVGAPRRLFADLGAEYRPPFGAAPLLALHPATDDD